MPTNGDWDFYLMSKNFFNKPRFKIFAATAVTIFTLASTFSATYAWFESSKVARVTSGSFSVVGPDQVSFDIYYLSSFTDTESHTRYGNYNPSITSFSGYEVEYEDATFTKINYVNDLVTNNPNPTDVRHLWPAHKLTFAIMVTSNTVSKLSLSNWGETTGTAITEDSAHVCLAWAIDVYGMAYSVQSTGNTDQKIAADIATGYASYYDDVIHGDYTDVFGYSEDEPAAESPNPKEVLDVVDTIPTNSSGYRTIVYFTIEFSNDESTFYRYDEDNDYYIKSTLGNSNCYEGLSLSSMEFTLE